MTDAVEAVSYKDKQGREIKQHEVVLIPFRVIKLAGMSSQLVHLETVEAYGHINPNVGGELRGRTKTALWVEPSQIEVSETK